MFIVLKISFNFPITIKGRQEKEHIDDRRRTAKYHQMLHMISSQFSISSRATRTFNTKLLEKIAVALMIKPNSSEFELRTSMQT